MNLKYKLLQFSLFCVLVASCTPSHYFYNIPKDKTYIDDGSKIDINLNNYEGYYRLIVRNSTKLEAISRIPKLDTLPKNRHVTDLQYFLIDKKNKRFLHISYIPAIRYFRKPNRAYMNSCYKDCEKVINIENMRMLNFGVIEQDSIFVYRDKKNNVEKKVVFSTQEDRIVLKEYIEKFKVQLNDAVFEKEYTIYYKMKELCVSLKKVKTDEREYKIGVKKSEKDPKRLYSSIDTLLQQITFAHANHPKKKNAIVFYYADTIKHSKSPRLYFREKGFRFCFGYP